MKAHERTMGILSLICFILSGILFFLPGVRFSAKLFAGLGVLGLLWLCINRLSAKYRVLKCCKVIFLAGFFGLVLFLGGLEILILSCGEEDYSGLQVDAVIVLGAGVNGETPSLTLQTRIDKAAEYIFTELEPDIPVVLSGGQGSGESISEAECMYRALRKSPLKPTDTPFCFLLEERSTSTAENFAFSKMLLEEYGVDTDSAVIAVVSNDFHMYRARFIARREGLTTIGIPAELPWWWLSTNYYLRESFGMVKTLFLE